jgi:hypothetical protein
MRELKFTILAFGGMEIGARKDENDVNQISPAFSES